CEASGDPPPSLTWRREDGRSFRVNGALATQWEGNQLSLASVQRQEAGAFLCVAKNGIPPAVSARALLYVK
ncbi:Immunoglobulin-like domain, partial [Trinorchestia longiramus]